MSGQKLDSESKKEINLVCGNSLSDGEPQASVASISAELIMRRGCRDHHVDELKPELAARTLFDAAGFMCTSTGWNTINIRTTPNINIYAFVARISHT